MTVVAGDGDTPFMTAATQGHTEIMSLLIIEGVDTEVGSIAGETARSIASAEGKLAEYEAAFTESSLTAAKLRSHRSLVENTIIPAMTAVNTCTNYGSDVSWYSPPIVGRRTNVSTAAVLDADMFWKSEIAENVFSFLDRHGLMEEEL